MESNHIIILANGLNGIGAIRSAAAAGLKVVAVMFSERDTSASSRLPVKKYVVDRERPEELAAVLTEVADHCGPCSVLACSDESAQLLSGLLETGGLSPHVAVMPGSDTVNALNDKKRECQRMQREGVSLPATYVDLSTAVVQGPLIIKPRTYEGYQVLGAKNRIVHSPQELDDFRAAFRERLDDFIAQDIIAGPDEQLWVCNVVFDRDSQLVAFFSFNRLGTMPSHYGVTSLAVGHCNEPLRRECIKIGKALNYTGPAMIEFKQDRADGHYYYIETNPRVGMCNWFDTCCGVNNVWASHQVAFGETVPSMPQRDGRVYWNPLGDLVARLEDREPLTRIIGRYGRLLFRRKVWPVFVWNDPLPAWRYGMAMLKSLGRRVWGRLKGRA